MQYVKRLVVVFLTTLALTPVFAQKTLPQQSVDDAFVQASDLFRKEKYASAQHRFDQLARRTDAHGTAYESDAEYYAAVCAERLGSDDALFRLSEFLRLHPESNKCNMVRFYQGNCYYAAGDFAKALQYYKQVESADVDYGHRSEYNFKMGYCYLMTDDRDHAKSHLARVLDGKSKYRSSALYYSAHLQYASGDYELALSNFQKLEKDRKFARIVPSYLARIYYYLGREDELLRMAPELLNENDLFKKGELQQMVGEVYFNRGEYRQAINYYRQAQVTTQTENQTKGCNTNDNTYQMGYSYYMLGVYDSATYYLSQKSACSDSIAQNALYTLGDAYLHLGKKMESRAAFREASAMDYDAKIKEDAIFNYAKLSCELNQNAYNESIRSFEDYLKRYPHTSHKGEIQEILTSLYCSTRNYKDALTLIEKIEPKNATLNQAYQRIVINRGIELFNERDLQQASQYFLRATKINAQPKSTTDAYYLYGESQFRLDNMTSAKSALDKFFVSSNAKRSPYYEQALYTFGYVCMQGANYTEGANTFRKFIAGAGKDVEARQLYDAHNRLGDCLYAQKRFDDAIEQYNLVITANAKDADYATFQKALAYGALGKNEEKLTYLNYIFERFDGSALASKAQFEIANTYLVCDNNEMALLYFDNFIKRYPKSVHVKEALLSKGLIYYNTERDQQALECFDELLNNYQGTDEARDALATVKSIYIAQNRVEEYFDYVSRTTRTTVSAAEQDSTTFMAAANRYYEGDLDNAASGFESYITHFPNGLFALRAHYYLADCYFKSGAESRALPHYEKVVSMSKNQYTETALAHAADIAFGLGDYNKALNYYNRLGSLSENDNSRLQARLGTLRCHNRMNNTDSTLAAAQRLLHEPKLTNELRDEAWLYEARSFYILGRTDSARVCYTLLAGSDNGEYVGEALYFEAALLAAEQRYGEAEKHIEAIAANPTSNYWLAKSFILWADIFYAQGNSMQAKQTLQSIIDNYDGEDLVNEALAKRNTILEAESTPPPAETEPEEIVITLPQDGQDE